VLVHICPLSHLHFCARDSTNAVHSASSSPECFTWRFSSSASPSSVYSVFNCYASGGTGRLLDAPPALTATSSTPSGGLNPPTDTTVTQPTPTDQPSGGGGGGAPVAPIVGGVVGGLAIIGIAVVAIIWMVVRHRRQQGPGGHGGSGADASTQGTQLQPSPGGGGGGGNFYAFPHHANQQTGYGPYGGYYPGEQKAPGQAGYDPQANVQPQYAAGTGYGQQPQQQAGVISELPGAQPRERAELGG
jgi:hypothetical protein